MKLENAIKKIENDIALLEGDLEEIKSQGYPIGSLKRGIAFYKVRLSRLRRMESKVNTAVDQALDEINSYDFYD